MSSGWSNIFLQMMAGDVPPMGLPVVGEGQLDLPWKLQIELLSFSWDISIKHDDKKPKGGLLGAAAGMAAAAGAGAAGAVVGQAGLAAAAVAAAAASLLMDKEKKGKVDLGTIKMSKRFDIASARLHSCADLDTPIPSALISVLHIKQGTRSIHEPGFTLLATGCRIEKIDVKMGPSGAGVEVTEDIELKFKNIVVTYSKRLGVDNIPMPPFVYASPPEPG